jgi:hypothetical protein
MNDAPNIQPLEIEGIEEILKSLERLPPFISNKLLYDVNKQILTDVVRSDLVAALPYSLRTKKGIKIVKARGTENGLYIGVSTDAFWLRFLQKGTKERKIKSTTDRSFTITKRYHKTGRRGATRTGNRGQISPRETGVVSTLNSKINEVLQAVQKDYSEMLLKAISRNLKKYTIKK